MANISVKINKSGNFEFTTVIRKRNRKTNFSHLVRSLNKEKSGIGKLVMTLKTSLGMWNHRKSGISSKM